MDEQSLWMKNKMDEQQKKDEKLKIPSILCGALVGTWFNLAGLAHH